MNDFTTQNGAEPVGAPPTIESLMAKLSDMSTPQYGRDKLLDQLTALHEANAAADKSSEQIDDAADEALAPPSSATGYHLEANLPPGVSIENEAELGTLKSSLHGLGVPASIASAAIGHIAELHRDGAFRSEQALDDALIVSRNQLHHVHGEAAPALIRDATAFIDRAVVAGKLTNEQADAICASPLAVSHAAMLARSTANRR